MRIFFGIMGLVIAATPAFAIPAPAPLIGLGVPAAAVVGGAMFVARLFKRK